MADAEARVVTRVDLIGLSEALEKFQRFTGSITDTQAALRKVGAIGEEAVRAGGVVTPDMMDKLVRNVEHLKRAEAEINRLLQERTARLNEIIQKSPVLRALIEQGVSPQEAITASIRGVGGRALGGAVLGVSAEQAEESKRLPDEIGRLQAQLAKVREGLPLAQAVVDKIEEGVSKGTEAGWRRLLPSAVSFFRTGLGLIGVGSAVGIAAEARGRAIQFYPRAADVAAFLGRYGRNVAGASLAAAGPYGLYPMDALRVAEELGAAGDRVTPAMIREFAGMGLFFGLGREGFAQRAREAVGAGTFQDLGQFRRSGVIAAHMAEVYGLTPAQRGFFLESNKNLIQQMARWYGGRPLNVQDYFAGVNGLMQALKSSGLPLAGAPIALDVARSLAGGLSPVGKEFGEVIRTGVLMGISTEDALATNKGIYFGMQQKINEMIRSPGGFLKAIQGLGRTVGIEAGPGVAPPSADQLTALAALAQRVPGMLEALGKLNLAGVPLERLFQRRPDEPLPKDLEKTMQGVLDATKKAAEEGWRRSDIEWTRSQVEGMGKVVIDVESIIKGSLGPGGALAVSLATSVISLLPGIIAGTAIGTAVGSAIGATGGGSLLLKALKLGGAAALLTAPFTMSGEGFGTARRAPGLEGQKLTPEEFREMERKARAGEVKAEPLMEQTLIMELVNGIWALSKEVARLVDSTEMNTKSTDRNTENAETKEWNWKSRPRGTTNRPMKP